MEKEKQEQKETKNQPNEYLFTETSCKFCLGKLPNKRFFPVCDQDDCRKKFWDEGKKNNQVSDERKNKPINLNENNSTNNNQLESELNNQQTEQKNNNSKLILGIGCGILGLGLIGLVVYLVKRNKK